ncbi:MAG TPA: hypothetical protein VLL76_04880 [Candidatus Omnitrophota bacterium]|nr:hypothetical protein [Candidatus Omnitrophota bacterium]
MIRLFAVVTAAALAGAAVLVVMQPPPPSAVSAEAFPPDCLSTQEKNWGVQVLYVRLSPDRRSVAVRYRVVDPERAKLFNAFLAKARIEEARGGVGLAVVAQPPGAPELGAVHDLTFANPDGALGLRRRVTLQVGPFRLDNLVVRG